MTYIPTRQETRGKDVMQNLHNREINAQLRQDALNILNQHDVIPNMLFIGADGWIEAVYDVIAGDDTLLKAWDTITVETDIYIHKPMLEVHNATGQATLRVHFNLLMRDERNETDSNAEQPSLWQRFKRLVS